MPKYSNKSIKILNTAHPQLQKLFNEAIKYVDISIVCGYRGQLEQQNAYNKGNSKVQWPNSKHNKQPSMAVDFKPYPDGKAIDYVYVAGIIMGIAKMLKINIKYGGDWNNNFKASDESFLDGGHIEL